MLLISFRVELPVAARKEAWKLATKQKVVVVAERAEVTTYGIKVTAPAFKKAEKDRGRAARGA
ncbi:hypothetical protein R5W24_001161 [Gemmata sp. JC717]|uniref:Uncharacterized protein n=1 Tax=Gemmata algarum TaxID=2975278 RepID=A0ABU5EZ03_9BACT|nr:hypothetical protein [Gemmata algarum]MDY3552081.1 hypothetical protein [Gemmata algarum]MDY3560153.1 hypothetical protein [Gemmata algarum]